MQRKRKCHFLQDVTRRSRKFNLGIQVKYGSQYSETSDITIKHIMLPWVSAKQAGCGSITNQNWLNFLV